MVKLKKLLASLMAITCMAVASVGYVGDFMGDHASSLGMSATALTITHDAPRETDSTYKYADTMYYHHSFTEMLKSENSDEFLRWEDSNGYEFSIMRRRIFHNENGKAVEDEEAYCVALTGYSGSSTEFKFQQTPTIPDDIMECVLARGITLENGRACNTIATRFNETFCDADAPKLTSISLTGVKYIADDAFRDVQNITVLDVPVTVVYIGSSAFANSSIANLSIDALISVIPDGMCSNAATKYVSITDPEIIVDIGEGAFKGSKITEVPVDIGAKGLVIQKDAFRDCVDLKGIGVPQQTVQIGDYAFKGCTNAVSISIPMETVNVGVEAFADCTSAENLMHSTVTVSSLGNKLKCEEGVFKNCSSLKALTTRIIFDGVIPDSAFEGCTSLTHFDAHGALTAIGDRAFADCTNLTKINFDADCIVFTGIESATLGAEAFKNCTSLTETIQTSKTIGNSAYENCTGLEEVSCRYMSIGSDVFKGCTGIKTADVCSIDESGFNAPLYEIPSGLFEGCSALTSINSNWQYVSKVGENAFKGCKSLTAAHIPLIHEVGASAFEGCTALGTLWNGTTVKGCEDECAYTEMYHDLFNPTYDGTNIDYIKISKCGVNAFKDSGLAMGIELETDKEGIVEIADSAFENTHVRGVKSDNFVNIGDNAFKTCHNIIYIQLKKPELKLTSGQYSKIGVSAFEDCGEMHQLYSIFINIDDIGAKAFKNCTPTKSEIVACHIGEEAFMTSNNMASVYINANPNDTPASVPFSIEKNAFSCPYIGRIIIREETDRRSGGNEMLDIAEDALGSATQYRGTNYVKIYDTDGNVVDEVLSSSYKVLPKSTKDFQSEDGDSVILGDYNQDGVLDVADYVVLEKFLLGKTKTVDITQPTDSVIPGKYWSRLDYIDTARDGKINVFDAVALRRSILNLATEETSETPAE